MEIRYIPEKRCQKCGQARWWSEAVLADPNNLKNETVTWKPIQCAMCSDEGATLIPSGSINYYEQLIGNSQ